MKRAESEAQGLAAMEHFLDKWGRIGSLNQPWTEAKRQAFEKLSEACEARFNRPVANVLDIGLGDMSHIDQWAPFVDQTVDYRGIDGSARMLGFVQGRYPANPPGREYIHQTIREWADEKEEGWDAIVCLDVLYYLPIDEHYEKAREALIRATDNYLLVSYSTNLDQLGNPKEVGDVGWDWFPRTWHHPEGFTILHQDYTPERQLPAQTLTLYQRD